jgi:protein-disulfide isomerase
MLEIRVLGSCCSKCDALCELTARTLDKANIPYHLVKVTDEAEIMAYGVLGTPALVMDNTVLAAGRLPKAEQILAWAQARV